MRTFVIILFFLANANMLSAEKALINTAEFLGVGKIKTSPDFISIVFNINSEIKTQYDAEANVIVISLIETDIKKIFCELRKRGVKIFGLTYRDPSTTQETTEQLNALDIEFDPVPANLSSEIRATLNMHDCGVIFANDGMGEYWTGDKGVYASVLLNAVFQTKLGQKNIIAYFADDRNEAVKEWNYQMQQQGISFISFLFLAVLSE
ncbi:MAG: DUF2608 domain-containing protein [Myxococcales bacterium]|nr:DUF2608 domain-containing protein [Myxococcales bacterium]USN50645.1 MAG: DUF2608 domain-containing protein [Myxococcales bacterium]